MNKDQFARLERHRKVKQKLVDSKPAVDAVPAFAELAADYLAQLALLDGTARKRPVTSQGATAANNTASAALIARLVKMANALWLLYRKESNQPEADKMLRRTSEYREMQELELATIGLDLSQRVTARQADLANYNIKAADVTALATDAQAFDAALQNPQLAIDDQKLKGAAAKATLSALNRFLRDDLRAGMELLKDTEPDAYNALREASQVDDAAYRKRRAKKAVGRAEQDGSPTGERRIYRVLEGSALTILKTFPPTLQIDALGETRTGGWSNFHLSAYVYKRPPADGIYDFGFLGTEPSGPTTDAITPCEAQERWQGYPTDLKGVRIHAEGEDGKGQYMEINL